MFSHIIYILATGCLFVGSVLTFDKSLPDYFYMIGTTLFLIKSILCLFEEINKKKRRSLYDDLI